MDAVAIVSDEVREIIRRRGIDPGRDAKDVRRLVEDAVAGYDERTLTRALPPLVDAEGAVKQVLDAVVGFSLSLRPKMPPNTEGCNVFTLPPKIEG
jgi:pilus assembly protein CpaF